MYAREVDGKVLTLGVSGMLWNRSLVMYDKETNSLWSHILGEAMQGPLKGKRLEQVPSVMTDWKSWSEQHPDGTVVMLKRTSKNYQKQFYQRLDQFVLGIAEGGKTKAWRLDSLKKKPVVHDVWEGQPVVVLFDSASVTARLYLRKVNNQQLTFEIVGGKIKDRETASTWEPVSGRAVAGPLKGQHLTALPAILSFTQVWLKFHPGSKIVAD